MSTGVGVTPSASLPWFRVGTRAGRLLVVGIGHAVTILVAYPSVQYRLLQPSHGLPRRSRWWIEIPQKLRQRVKILFAQVRGPPVLVLGIERREYLLDRDRSPVVKVRLRSTQAQQHGSVERPDER